MALQISTQYKDIADQLINKYNSTLGQIDTSQVLFLEETEKCPAKKLAEIQLVRPPYTFVCNYKYIITVYSAKTIAMTPAQINILILHELMHIDADFEKLVQHDIMDFSELLLTYGADWQTNPNVVDPL